MAWMSDEAYELMKDTREKKHTAASAFKTRTHCGKGGRVKFPSDYLSKKELKAMNGKVKEYNMNKPMNWETFKTMPQDLQIEYVKSLREKFGVPDKNLAEAMGVHPTTLCRYFRCLRVSQGSQAGSGHKKWDSTEFDKWWNMVEEDVDMDENTEETETMVEEATEEVTGPIDINKPITWAEFRSLPDALKIAYINWLRDKFNLPDKAIADMFGVHRTTMGPMLDKFNLRNDKRSPRTNWNKEAFLAWRTGADPKLVKENMVEDTESMVEDQEVEDILDLCAKLVEDLDETEKELEPAVLPVVDDGVDVRKVVSVNYFNPSCTVSSGFDELKNDICKLDERISVFENTSDKIAFGSAPIQTPRNYVPVFPKSGSMTFEHNYGEDILKTIECILSSGRVNLTVSWECVNEGETESFEKTINKTFNK